jgi:hypothetical protein
VFPYRRILRIKFRRSGGVLTPGTSERLASSTFHWPRAQNFSLTRSSHALPRAGQHTSKLDVPEALSKFPRPVLATRSQRNVRAPGVLAGERPLGFAVSNEVNAREHVLPADYLVAPHFQFLFCVVIAPSWRIFLCGAIQPARSTHGLQMAMLKMCFLASRTSPQTLGA